MAAFKIPTDVKLADIVHFFTPFLTIVNYNRLRTRIRELKRRQDANPFAHRLLAERHELEFAIWDAIDRFRNYGRRRRIFKGGRVNIPQMRAYQFIVDLTEVHRHLTSAARKRLDDRITQAFTGESDLLSLEQEVLTVGYLMRQRCTVECHDLETGGGHDFVATRDGVEFEVECKLLSRDKGRQVHQLECLALLELLHPLLDWSAFMAKGQGAVVRVEVPDRLDTTPAALLDLSKDVLRTIKTELPIADARWTITYSPFALAGTMFESESAYLRGDQAAFMRGLTGVVLERHFTRARPGKAVLILAIDSEKPDTPVAATIRTLKEAAGQLSGARPGIIVATVADMPADALEELAHDPNGNAFMRIARKIFSSRVCQNVQGIHFSGQMEYGLLPNGTLGAMGPVYKFVSASHPGGADPRLRLDDGAEVT